MRYLIELILILLVSNFPSVLDAQFSTRSSSDEYIVSSSPLKDGGRVISRSTADTGVQTVTTVAEISALRVNPQATDTGVTPANFNSNAGSIYPYPTSLTRQSVARGVINTPVTYPPFRAKASASNQQLNYQVPTLGITPTARTARNTAVVPYPSPQLPTIANQRRMETTAARVAQNCDCARPTNLQVTGYQVPASDPFASLTAPSLTIQPPVVTSQYNPGTLQAQPGASSQSPNMGSGTYQPLIRLTNMKPGTYIGRGIIGQPKAYVDGQPVRNLVRYIFP